MNTCSFSLLFLVLLLISTSQSRRSTIPHRSITSCYSLKLPEISDRRPITAQALGPIPIRGYKLASTPSSLPYRNRSAKPTDTSTSNVTPMPPPPYTRGRDRQHMECLTLSQVQAKSDNNLMTQTRSQMPRPSEYRTFRRYLQDEEMNEVGVLKCRKKDGKIREWGTSALFWTSQIITIHRSCQRNGRHQ
jgi:hypothetical protein